MPGQQHPLPLTPFKDTALSQRENGSLLLRPVTHEADVIEFHRKPGEISLCPDFEFMDRNVEPLNRNELILHVALELRPPGILASTDCVTGDIGIMSHQPGECRHVLFGVGANE